MTFLLVIGSGGDFRLLWAQLVSTFLHVCVLLGQQEKVLGCFEQRPKASVKVGLAHWED